MNIETKERAKGEAENVRIRNAPDLLMQKNYYETGERKEEEKRSSSRDGKRSRSRDRKRSRSRDRKRSRSRDRKRTKSRDRKRSRSRDRKRSRSRNRKRSSSIDSVYYRNKRSTSREKDNRKNKDWKFFLDCSSFCIHFPLSATLMPWLWALGCGARPRTGARSDTQGEEEEVAHITSHTPPIQQSPVWRGEGEEWRGGGGGEVDGAMKSPGRGILCGSWHEKVQYLLARASPVSSGMRKSSIFWHEKVQYLLA